MNDGAASAGADLVVHALPEQPYPGLRPFTREEWTIFFGRESMVQEVVERLVARQLVAVHGDSGCGKSSLVAAGVMSFLERDQARAGGRWWTTIMRPEDRPLVNLARALAGPPGTGEPSRALDILRLLNRGEKAPAAVAEYLGCSVENNICVLFDQFEEMFEHARHGGEPEAELVTEFLVGLAAARPRGLHAILTMRSDYLGQCAHYRGFAETVNETQYLVPRMERPALIRAIREPAALYGGAVDLDLAARLVADAGTGQDQLPLIQHGLMLMWRKAERAGRKDLGLFDYAAGGDLAAQLSSHADAIMAESVTTSAEEPVVEAIFRALTDRNRDGQAIRRRQTFAELVAVTGAPREILARIISRFRAPDASFLRPFGDAPLADDDHVDISHEAFIRNWKKISAPGTGWLDREAEDGLIWTSLRITAAAFVRNSQARLSAAAAEERAQWLTGRNEAWAARYGGDWNAVSQLIAASSQAAERLAARRRRWVLTGAVAAAVICALLAGFAGFQTIKANRAAQLAGQAALEAMLQKGEADRQRAEAELQRAEAERQRAELEANAREAMLDQTISLAALSRVAQSEGLYVVAVKLAVAGWPRSGEENRPALRRAIASLAEAFRNFRERLVVEGHEQLVRSAAYSPDGSRIVTASPDGTARVWDAKSGVELFRMTMSAAVASAAFSPDGSRIVTACLDSTARVWDATTGVLLLTLKGHSAGVNFAVFSPDSKRILTTSDDRTARLWKAADGEQTLVLQGHERSVSSGEFSPDGNMVVTASDDGTARIWDAGVGTPLRVLRGHERWVRTAQFSPDGSRVVTASGDKTARVWDAATGEQLLELRGHDWELRSAAFSPDGVRIVTASDDWTARIWDATTGRQLLMLPGHRGRVWSAEFASDGSRVLTASDDTTTRIWDAQLGKRVTTLRHRGGPVYVAAYSHDGKQIVTSSDDAVLRVWDATTTVLQHEFGGNQEVILSAAFSPDGKRILTGSDHSTARIWDVATGAAEALEGHEGPIVAVAWSPDGRLAATASADTTARIWDVASGKQLRILTGNDGPVAAVAFSPDGQRIVTASGKVARVWELSTGRELLVLRGHEFDTLSAAFSHDGRRIVTASHDWTARVWEAASGAQLLVMNGHEGRVLSAGFSSDDTRIVTSSEDGSARVWDAASGAELSALKGHGDVVFSAMYSLDGSRVLTGSGDGTAAIWDVSSLESGDAFRIACLRLGSTDLGVAEARYGLSKLAPICGDSRPVPIGDVVLKE